MEETKEKKKRSNITAFYANMTAEEKAAHYEKVKQATRERHARKRQALLEATEEAKTLLPQILAHKIIEETHGPEFNPSLETIERLRMMLEQGLSVKEMRTKFFKEVPQATWEKMTRFMFKDEVAHAEDLGMNLSNARRSYIKTLEKRIKTLRKEIKLYKKEKKPITSLLSQLHSAEDRKFTLEMEFNENLHKLGIVGDKAKAASINIHMNVPRPKAESAIDVTPKENKSSLNDLLK